MRNIGLILRYDGTNYCGWQRQKTEISIQQKVEEAVEEVTGESSFVQGCGRTDAGVHALNYLANFETKSNIPAERFKYALNTKLPDDISVLDSFLVEDDFNSRFSIEKKTYRYEIYTNEIANPFLRNYAWHFPYELNLELMQSQAKKIVGTHDFSGFMAVGGQVKTTVRTIYDAVVFKDGEKVVFEVTGNGFLYNMVRILAGTLCYIGAGKIKEDMKDILESLDRSRAGITAPPEGLYMKKVYFGEKHE
ncbi:MAG: tRNA pseudouridine(38-40) synthase TruA [Clostridia bacterium]|nr:tRNA pseudouridine(38-40) synthase TruA [Clostridia bacterium]